MSDKKVQYGYSVSIAAAADHHDIKGLKKAVEMALGIYGQCRQWNHHNAYKLLSVSEVPSGMTPAEFQGALNRQLFEHPELEPYRLLIYTRRYTIEPSGEAIVTPADVNEYAALARWQRQNQEEQAPMATPKKWDVELQPGGWPVEMAEEDKEPTVAIVKRTILAIQKQGGAATLNVIYDVAKDDLRRLKSWKDAVLWDWIYCSIERALRTLGAEETWTLVKK